MRTGEIDPDALGVERFRAGEGEVKAELAGCVQPRGADVVAVAGPHHLFPRNRAAMFFERHHVGHDLTGVGAVGQPIDDGNRGIFRHLLQRRLFKGADHDEIDIARQYAGGVGDGFAVAKLHVGARQHHGLPAHLAHADVEGNPCAGRGFLENQRDHAAGKRLIVIGRAFGAVVARGLHGAGAVDHRAKVGGVGGVDIEKMGHVRLSGRRRGLSAPGPPRIFLPKQMVKPRFPRRWRWRRGGSAPRLCRCRGC
ncbi:hypothetical protein GALL_431160 [mine drainage metagenome]|uniref:Uncharacterized protein n=1 Tax=mine drainage metagenome TaxID=410659 RepID=A0A1J5Q5E4_9ZZZZ